MQISKKDRKKLNNGTSIPYLGFGTYLIRGQAVKEAVLDALEAGYRHIDTAAAYGNEKQIGEALRESRIPREEIYITTKLWNEDQGYESTFDAFKRSLDNFRIDYINLYLIHWPISEKRTESWKAMEEIVVSDSCKAIGVSNFTERHLEELLESSDVVPAVNQIEFNPFLFQKDLLQFCSKKGITVEAYSPLSRARKFDHPVLKDLSGKYHKTPAQIMLRWALEHDIVVIPKSIHKKRIIENSEIFDFSIVPADIAKLDALNEGYRVAWNPASIP